MMTMPEPGDGIDDVVAGSGPRDDIAKALDEISLEQALVDVEVANARAIDLTSRLLSSRRELLAAKKEVADVEVANARAIDLTSRLLSSRRELLAAKKEVADLRQHIDELTAHIESITGSPGFAWVHRLSKLRRSPR